MLRTSDRRGFLWTLFAVCAPDGGRTVLYSGSHHPAVQAPDGQGLDSGHGAASACTTRGERPGGGVWLVCGSRYTYGATAPWTRVSGGAVIWANIRVYTTRTNWWATAKALAQDRSRAGDGAGRFLHRDGAAELFPEWMFHPVPGAQFDSEAASKLDKAEMILAVRLGSDARAYPISEMAYPSHIVNDVVNDVPICVTY